MGRAAIKEMEKNRSHEEYLRHTLRCLKAKAKPLSELQYITLSGELHDQNVTDAYIARKEKEAKRK